MWIVRREVGTGFGAPAAGKRSGMECPNCGADVVETEDRCPSCALPLQVACPDCGAHAPAEEDTCPACGASLAHASEPI